MSERSNGPRTHVKSFLFKLVECSPTPMDTTALAFEIWSKILDISRDL
jgi:hypothetical protein